MASRIPVPSVAARHTPGTVAGGFPHPGTVGGSATPQKLASNGQGSSKIPLTGAALSAGQPSIAAKASTTTPQVTGKGTLQTGLSAAHANTHALAATPPATDPHATAQQALSDAQKQLAVANKDVADKTAAGKQAFKLADGLVDQIAAAQKAGASPATIAALKAALLPAVKLAAADAAAVTQAKSAAVAAQKNVDAAARSARRNNHRMDASIFAYAIALARRHTDSLLKTL